MKKKILIEIAKFLIGAIAGALGMSVTGCAAVPVFAF